MCGKTAWRKTECNTQTPTKNLKSRSLINAVRSLLGISYIYDLTSSEWTQNQATAVIRSPPWSSTTSVSDKFGAILYSETSMVAMSGDEET